MRRMRALVLLLILSTFVTDVALACGRQHCGLNRVRSCGNSNVEIEDALLLHKCLIPDTVVAATLTDVRRLAGEYLLLLEMPGVASGDLKVSVEESDSHPAVLSISGVSYPSESRLPFGRNDRGPATKLFARKFVLPHHVDASRISHQLDQGLLRVSLPIVAGEDSEQHPGGQEQKIAGLLARFLVPWNSCTISEADKLIQPEPLAAQLPDDQCNGAVGVQSPADIVMGPGWYQVEFEMPGVSSAEVSLDWDESGGAVLSVVGSVDEEGDGGSEALRIERGGASSKVFARKFYFSPRTLEKGAAFEQTLEEGLLRVRLPEVLPNLWERTVGLIRRLNSLWKKKPPPRQHRPLTWEDFQDLNLDFKLYQEYKEFIGEKV